MYLDQLDQTTREWQSQLETDTTDAELLWQPFPGGHSIAGLLLHIAEVEHYWLHHIALGEPYRDMEREFLDGGVIDQFGVQWATPPAGRPLSFYLDLLVETRERTKALLKDVPATHVAQRGDREFTLHWLMTHVIVHEAYHGGQAVLLQLQWRKRG